MVYSYTVAKDIKMELQSVAFGMIGVIFSEALTQMKMCGKHPYCLVIIGLTISLVTVMVYIPSKTSESPIYKEISLSISLSVIVCLLSLVYFTACEWIYKSKIKAL